MHCLSVKTETQWQPQIPRESIHYASAIRNVWLVRSFMFISQMLVRQRWNFLVNYIPVYVYTGVGMLISILQERTGYCYYGACVRRPEVTQRAYISYLYVSHRRTGRPATCYRILWHWPALRVINQTYYYRTSIRRFRSVPSLSQFHFITMILADTSICIPFIHSGSRYSTPPSQLCLIHSCKATHDIRTVEFI